MAAQVIFDGDSLLTVEYPWNNPAWFAVEKLCRAGYDIGYARSVAVSGQTMADMAADGASQVDALYSGSYSANILVVLGGTNDIRTAGGASA
jgi:lysophospholipase L1-like esterase